MHKTFIFLGPSLTHAEAHSILPNANYLPPARCGDVLRVMRLQPQHIAIIDGYFENTPAVWHKEIIYALTQGVQVYGASSMGALRGSELAEFGMQVIGQIGQNYLKGKYIDDDEVALFHSTGQSNYEPLSDALVNINATLEAAVQAKIIDQATYQYLIDLTKTLYYPERNFANLFDLCYQQNFVDPIKNLRAWLAKGHYIDAKRLDAITLLKHLATLPAMPAAANAQVQCNQSIFFRTLHKNVQCRPFSSYQNWLPLPEKVALAARYLGRPYRLVRRLAYLLHASYALAKHHFNFEKLTHNPAEIDIQLGYYTCHLNIQDNNDFPLQETEEFKQRIQHIHQFIIQQQRNNDFPIKPNDYILLLLRMSKMYLHCKEIAQKNQQDILAVAKEQFATEYTIMAAIAQCWWLVEYQAHRLNLEVNLDVLQTYSNRFRAQQQLVTPEATQKWLEKHDLDLISYQYMVSASARLNFLILQNNIDTLVPVVQIDTTWWLMDAMRLTSIYSVAKNLLMNPKQIKYQQHLTQTKEKDLQTYAFGMDFLEGEAEFWHGLQDSHQE